MIGSSYPIYSMRDEKVLAAIHRVTVRKINLSHQVASATSVLCFAGVCSTIVLLFELHICSLTRID